MTNLQEHEQGQPGARTPADVVEKAKATGRDVQDAAISLAQSSQEAIKAHASDALDAAKDLASSARERVQDKLSDQKGAGADYAEGFARSMRQAAEQFDDRSPLAATYIRKAAGQIESASNALRDGNVNDLVQGVQRFARSQPTAFFGLALLAGFGVVRFLKSATPEDAGGPPESDPQWVGSSGNGRSLDHRDGRM
jgi:hypothetical protein